jgi:hypothetical protein
MPYSPPDWNAERRDAAKHMPHHNPDMVDQVAAYAFKEVKAQDFHKHLDLRSAKPKLHWMQWVTYIIVCITCIAVLVAMLETYLFIQDFRDWVNQLGKAFSDNLGVN